MSEGIDLAPDKDASPQEVQGANKWLTGTEVGDRRAADVNIVGSITLATSGGGGGGGGDVNIDEYGGVSTTLGQKTKSASIPVTLASDQDALPVTDNGGSLTVDGTVALSGTSDVNLAQVAGTTTAVNTGNASAGTQRVVLASDQPQVSVRGNAAEGAAPGNPVPIAGKDVFGVMRIPTMLQASTFNLFAVVNADTNANTQAYRATTGESFALGASTDNTSTNAAYLLIDALKRLNVVGQVAHGSTNSGNPVVTGAEAIADPASISAVTAGQATKLYSDLSGLLFNRNLSFNKVITTELNALETTYNNVTTTVSSSDIVSKGFRKCQLGFTGAFAGTPTSVFVYVETKFPSGTYRQREDGFIGQWAYTRAILTAKPEVCCEFDINCEEFRITIDTTGTTVSNTFTLSNVEIVLSS